MTHVTVHIKNNNKKKFFMVKIYRFSVRAQVHVINTIENVKWNKPDITTKLSLMNKNKTFIKMYHLMSI